MGADLAVGTLRERILADASQLSAQSTRAQREVLDRIADTFAREVGDTCCIALLEHGRLDAVAEPEVEEAAAM